MKKTNVVIGLLVPCHFCCQFDGCQKSQNQLICCHFLHSVLPIMYRTPKPDTFHLVSHPKSDTYFHFNTRFRQYFLISKSEITTISQKNSLHLFYAGQAMSTSERVPCRMRAFPVRCVDRGSLAFTMIGVNCLHPIRM